MTGSPDPARVLQHDRQVAPGPHFQQAILTAMKCISARLIDDIQRLHPRQGIHAWSGRLLNNPAPEDLHDCVEQLRLRDAARVVVVYVVESCRRLVRRQEAEEVVRHQVVSAQNASKGARNVNAPLGYHSQQPLVRQLPREPGNCKLSLRFRPGQRIGCTVMCIASSMLH
jgi:hypothetical protein